MPHDSRRNHLLREKYNILIFSLCNDYLFYFAEDSLYTANTYEAQSSFFEIGEAERLIKKIEKSLNYFTCYDKML
jgi:hypothetical protein